MTDTPSDDEHPIPPNPLEGRSGWTGEMVASLSDDDVIAYVRHWEAMHARYRARGDGHGGWWCSKQISAGEQEARRRAIPYDTVHPPQTSNEKLPWN